MSWILCPFDDSNGDFSSKVFEECVRGFRKDNPDRQVLSYKSQIKQAATEYKERIPTNVESFPTQSNIPDTDKKRLLKTYSNKFAKLGSPGRKYYDEIMNTVPNGLCPICGVGQIEALDHYLPKSKYPLLAVTPTNLIPVCTSCNDISKKGDYCGNHYDEMLIHPYFDDKPTCIWLKATLQQHPCFRIYFESCFPDDALMQKRFSTHLRIFRLNKVYESNAMNAVLNNKLYWAQLYEKADRSGFLDSLINLKESCEHHDLNSWSSAMYRALVQQVDVLINYITTK